MHQIRIQLNKMIFERNKSVEKCGRKIGYLFSYLLFTTMLYFILINKLPTDWSFFHVMIISLLVVVVGTIIQRALR